MLTPSESSHTSQAIQCKKEAADDSMVKTAEGPKWGDNNKHELKTFIFIAVISHQHHLLLSHGQGAASLDDKQAVLHHKSPF